MARYHARHGPAGGPLRLLQRFAKKKKSTVHRITFQRPRTFRADLRFSSRLHLSELKAPSDSARCCSAFLLIDRCAPTLAMHGHAAGDDSAPFKVLLFVLVTLETGDRSLMRRFY